VIDPANETKVTNNAFIPKGGVTLVSSGVLATAQNRAEVETIGRTASTSHILRPTNEIAALTAAARTAPIPGDVRARAVREVEQQLVRVGLLAPNGEISEETKRRHSFTRTSHLPTPGFFVRSCRDECDVCEPSLLRSIDLCLTSTIDRCCSLKPPCLADLKDRISSAYDWMRNSLTGIFWPPASSSPPQAPSSP